MSEELFTCPLCLTPNFTRRGLRQHWCEKKALPGDKRKSAPLDKEEWQAIVDGRYPEFTRERAAAAGFADSTAIVPASASDDAEMGAQLTAQYHKTVAAMPEILKFAAMVMIVERKLVHVDRLGGAGNKGGLADWLREHAPEVPRATAIRYRDMGLGIAHDYAELVGVKVAKRFALCDLVTADPDSLPAPARKKQQALFDYISGTSQKSWLDKIRAPKSRGGDHGGSKGVRKTLTPEEAKQLLRTLATQAAEALSTVYKEQAYTVLVDAELDGLVDHCQTVLECVKAWRKMTKGERKEALAAQITRQIGEGK